MSAYLAAILERKAREVIAMQRHRATLSRLADAAMTPRAEAARASLVRSTTVRIVAEVKFRSPSAGTLREKRAGEALRVARAYVAGGASTVSVLADRASFDGSISDVARVAQAIDLPVLFKEFVLDEAQIDAACACGASLVLLLVCALEPSRLRDLIGRVQARGMEAVVEAANEREVEIAIAAGAKTVGVNARDLRTFRVDPQAAERSIALVPRDRIAVYMSGVKTRDDLARVAATRADAVLVGESLMRAADPQRALSELLGRDATD